MNSKLILIILVILPASCLADSIDTLDSIFFSHLRFKLRDIGSPVSQCAHFWQGIDAKLKGTEEIKLDEEISLNKVDIKLLVDVKNMLEAQKGTSNSIVQFVDFCVQTLSSSSSTVITKPTTPAAPVALQQSPPQLVVSSEDVVAEFKKEMSKLMSQIDDKLAKNSENFLNSKLKIEEYAKQISTTMEKFEAKDRKISELETKLDGYAKQLSTYMSQISDKIGKSAESNECQKQLVNLEKENKANSAKMILLSAENQHMSLKLSRASGDQSKSAEAEQKCQQELIKTKKDCKSGADDGKNAKLQSDFDKCSADLAELKSKPSKEEDGEGIDKEECKKKIADFDELLGSAKLYYDEGYHIDCPQFSVIPPSGQSGYSSYGGYSGYPGYTF